MSLYHYLASEHPLPLGERGGQKSLLDRSGDGPYPVLQFLFSASPHELPEGIIDLSSYSEKDIAVYDTLADAAGIYLDALEPKYETVRLHFTLPYVYRVAANLGGFHFSPEMKNLFPDEYDAHVKCVKVLFELMDEAGGDQAKYELYSCCVGAEQEERDEALTMTLKLSGLALGERFALKNRQFIRIVKQAGY